MALQIWFNSSTVAPSAPNAGHPVPSNFQYLRSSHSDAESWSKFRSTQLKISIRVKIKQLRPQVPVIASLLKKPCTSSYFIPSPHPTSIQSMAPDGAHHPIYDGYDNKVQTSPKFKMSSSSPTTSGSSQATSSTYPWPTKVTRVSCANAHRWEILKPAFCTQLLLHSEKPAQRLVLIGVLHRLQPEGGSEISPPRQGPPVMVGLNTMNYSYISIRYIWFPQATQTLANFISHLVDSYISNLGPSFSVSTARVLSRWCVGSFFRGQVCPNQKPERVPS